MAVVAGWSDIAVVGFKHPYRALVGRSLLDLFGILCAMVQRAAWKSRQKNHVLRSASLNPLADA